MLCIQYLYYLLQSILNLIVIKPQTTRVTCLVTAKWPPPAKTLRGAIIGQLGGSTVNDFFFNKKKFNVDDRYIFFKRKTFLSSD